MKIVVGVADCRVSSDVSDVLVTYSLGSCIAVLIHDPVACVGGLLHFMLPASSSEALTSGKSPYMFADTGIPLLFWEAYRIGACKTRLRVRIVGGAQMAQGADVFQVGTRNTLATRKILWKAGMLVDAEDLGGKHARTVSLDVDSGRVSVKSPDIPGQREL